MLRFCPKYADSGCRLATNRRIAGRTHTAYADLSGPPVRYAFDADANDTGDLQAWRLRIYYGEHPEEDQDGDEGTTAMTPEFQAIDSATIVGKAA